MCEKDKYEDTLRKITRKRLILKTDKTFFSTMFISINVIMFMVVNLYATRLVVANPYFRALDTFGMKVNEKILAGEYWRLITPIILHGGIMHVFFNSYAIHALSIVERIFGNLKYLLIYLVAGFTGSIASFVFSSNPSVGASGAVFGLMGSLLYFGIEKPEIFKKYFGSRVITVLLINIFIGETMPGIDNYAHMGGLLGGFLAAGMLSVDEGFDKKGKRFLYAIALLIAVIIGLYYGFKN